MRFTSKFQHLAIWELFIKSIVILVLTESLLKVVVCILLLSCNRAKTEKVLGHRTHQPLYFCRFNCGYRIFLYGVEYTLLNVSGKVPLHIFCVNRYICHRSLGASPPPSVLQINLRETICIAPSTTSFHPFHTHRQCGYGDIN